MYTNVHLSLSRSKTCFNNNIIICISRRIHNGHNGSCQGCTSTTSNSNIYSNADALNLQHKIPSKLNVISTYVTPSTDDESVLKMKSLMILFASNEMHSIQIFVQLVERVDHFNLGA